MNTVSTPSPNIQECNDYQKSPSANSTAVTPKPSIKFKIKSKLLLQPQINSEKTSGLHVKAENSPEKTPEVISSSDNATSIRKIKFKMPQSSPSSNNIASKDASISKVSINFHSDAKSPVKQETFETPSIRKIKIKLPDKVNTPAKPFQKLKLKLKSNHEEAASIPNPMTTISPSIPNPTTTSSPSKSDSMTTTSPSKAASNT